MANIRRPIFGLFYYYQPKIDVNSLFLQPLQLMADTSPTHKLHVDNHLDPMDTILTKGVHVYGHLEVVATTASEGALAVVGGGKRRC